ncbi:MAG: hypothetical protein HRS57_02795 [Mycoplasmataceae bacterium]|nr:hypothetical protein [Mycoplasmataceae bacterium]
MINYYKVNSLGKEEEISKKDFKNAIEIMSGIIEGDVKELHILRSSAISIDSINKNEKFELDLYNFFGGEEIKLSCSKWTASVKYQQMFNKSLIDVVDVIEKWNK